MDLTTHLTLAARLLDSCGFDRRNVIFSLLPEIDIKPAHYHRMFGNIFMYQTTILDTAVELFRAPEVAERNFPALRDRMIPVVEELKKEHEALDGRKDVDRFEQIHAHNRFYCYQRLLAELPGFFEQLDKVANLLGEEILQPGTDRIAGAVALLSHTYFVTYTYPPMPFIPFSPMAPQRIEFADKIDYFEFKGLFSDSNAVAHLCQKLAAHEQMWTRHLDFSSENDSIIRGRMEAANGQPYRAQALVKAMIERLGDLAPGIQYDAVQKGVRWYLGRLGCVAVVHSDRERHFLEHVDACLEETLESLMP